MHVATLVRETLTRGAPQNWVRKGWDQLERLPGGKHVFSLMVGRAAPYTGSIRARVVELGVGHARIEMRDRQGLRNHLSSLHAVALVNLAELTGNLALAYSLPDDARFIVAGIEIEYLKKARGTITGTCTLGPIESAEKREYPVLVTLSDAQGVTVASATLRSLVGPKPPR